MEMPEIVAQYFDSISFHSEIQAVKTIKLLHAQLSGFFRLGQ